MFKTEEWEMLNQIKFFKNIKIHQCVFKSKDSFVNFIEDMSKLVGKSDVIFDILITNDHCNIKLDSITSLKKYITKYNQIFSLDVVMMCKKNKTCSNAIEISYKSFESRKSKTYLKIYSDQESWLNMAESKIIDEYLPKRRIAAILFNDKIDFLLYMIFTVGVLYKVGLDRETALNIDTNFSGDLAITYFTYSDFIIVVTSAIAISYFIQSVREIFIPTIKIKQEKSRRLKLFVDEKMKDTMNVFGFIVGIISLIITIFTLFK